MNLAPNGKPSNLTDSQYKLVRKPEFKAWFGDWENDPANASKVVDENGEPLPVYHGTNSEFYKFKKSKGKGNIKQKSINFSSNKNVSENYGTRIIECFLNLKNPFIKNYNGENYHTITFNSRFDNRINDIPDNIVNNAQTEKKYDGVIFLNIQDSKSAYDKFSVPIANNYYAFNNNQIKLADGTNTTFDGNNPDIRYNDGGSIPKELYHYTSETNFDRIFDSNILNPSQKYGNRLSFTSDSEYHKKEHALDYGNINVRITFDNEKLISDGYSFFPFDHSSKQNKIGKEFEYIIITPIKNVKKYIKNITIFEGNSRLGYIDKTATDYANKYYLNYDIRFDGGGGISKFDYNKNEITFNDFHLSTFANYSKIKAKEIPQKPANFISRSGSKYWYEEDSVIRESNHWGRTIASCNWLLNSCAFKGHSQGVCKLSDFKRIKENLLYNNQSSIGKKFVVGKTVLRRNGGGCMDIEKNEGIYLRESSDFYIFDKFRVGKQTLAYVEEKDIFADGGIPKKVTFNSIGSAIGFGTIPIIEGHDMIAECDCGEKFTYQNSKKDILWQCPKCNVKKGF